MLSQRIQIHKKKKVVYFFFLGGGGGGWVALGVRRGRWMDRQTGPNLFAPFGLGQGGGGKWVRGGGGGAK